MSSALLFEPTGERVERLRGGVVERGVVKVCHLYGQLARRVVERLRGCCDVQDVLRALLVVESLQTRKTVYILNDRQTYTIIYYNHQFTMIRSNVARGEKRAS